MYGLLFNMILSTKSKIYQQVLLLYVCEKISEIASGIGVGVQRTVQWRLSSNHLGMHPLLVQTVIAISWQKSAHTEGFYIWNVRLLSSEKPDIDDVFTQQTCWK